ncbi:MAG: four helix bundle protein [Ferruginibacter sp.]|nr:four helix bundle protein [Ferruginibacter sp.]
MEIIHLYKFLQQNKEFVISKQLLRSATSIGANAEEGNGAQTKKEFISKMSLASKEARETKYWLRLLQKSQLVSNDYTPYLLTIEQISNILTRIVKTSQESLEESK